MVSCHTRNSVIIDNPLPISPKPHNFPNRLRKYSPRNQYRPFSFAVGRKTDPRTQIEHALAIFEPHPQYKKWPFSAFEFRIFSITAFFWLTSWPQHPAWRLAMIQIQAAISMALLVPRRACRINTDVGSVESPVPCGVLLRTSSRTMTLHSGVILFYSRWWRASGPLQGSIVSLSRYSIIRPLQVTVFWASPDIVLFW